MALTDTQIHDLAYPLMGIITAFYEDPKNEEEFQKWLQQQTELADTKSQ